MGADALIFFRLVLEWYGVFQQVEDLYNQIVATVDFDESEITLDEKTEALKQHTLAVARLNLSIACYPLTAAAVVFVDESGAWIG